MVFDFFINFLNKGGDVNPKIVDSQFDFSGFNPWDPVGSVDLIKIKFKSADVYAKYLSLKNDPNRAKRKLIFWSFIAILIFILDVVIFVKFLSFEEYLRLFFLIMSLGILPAIGVYAYYESLARDMIKIQIAQSNGWIYDPSEDFEKWRKLKINFYEIFQKGDEKQNVEDQFWGSIIYEGKRYDFYAGLFFYTDVSYDIKGRKQERTFTKHFFSIRLNKTIKARFFLYPEGFGSKFKNFFSTKEINTESIEFNKRFAFSYNGSKDENALEIVKTLSPAVQNQLVNLSKRKRDSSILFSDSCVFFMFDGFFLKKMKTSLFKGVDIDEADKVYLDNELKVLIDIAVDVAKYLD